MVLLKPEDIVFDPRGFNFEDETLSEFDSLDQDIQSNAGSSSADFSEFQAPSAIQESSADFSEFEAPKADFSEFQAPEGDRSQEKKESAILREQKRKGIDFSFLDEGLLTKFGDVGQSISKGIGGFLGTEALGGAIGDTVLEAGELAEDVSHMTLTGELREREEFKGAETLAKGIGGAAQIATTFAAPGVGGAAKTLGGALLKSAGTGLVGGALTGASEELAETGSFENVGEEALFGGLTGLAFGAFLGGGSKLAGNIIKKIGNKGLINKLKQGVALTDDELARINPILEKNQKGIQELVMPKATARVIDKARGKGLVSRPKQSKISKKLLGEADRVIKPDVHQKRIKDTVSDELPELIGKKDIDIFDAGNKISKRIEDIAKDLSPKTTKVRVSKKELIPIYGEAEELSNKYLKNSLYQGKEKMIQAELNSFKKTLDTLGDNPSLEDIRQIRIKYDKTVDASVKNFDPSVKESRSKELLKSMWLDQRRLVNDKFHDLAEKNISDIDTRKMFGKMSDLFDADSNISTKVGMKSLKGKSGLFSKKNFFKLALGSVITGGAGGLGISRLTGN